MVDAVAARDPAGDGGVGEGVAQRGPRRPRDAAGTDAGLDEEGQQGAAVEAAGDRQDPALEVGVERAEGGGHRLAQTPHVLVAVARRDLEDVRGLVLAHAPGRPIERDAGVGGHRAQARVPGEPGPGAAGRHEAGRRLGQELEAAEQRHQGALRGGDQEGVVGERVPERARGADVGHDLEHVGVPSDQGVGALGGLAADLPPGSGRAEEAAEPDAAFAQLHALGRRVGDGGRDAVALEQERLAHRQLGRRETQRRAAQAFLAGGQVGAPRTHDNEVGHRTPLPRGGQTQCLPARRTTVNVSRAPPRPRAGSRPCARRCRRGRPRHACAGASAAWAAAVRMTRSGTTALTRPRSRSLGGLDAGGTLELVD